MHSDLEIYKAAADLAAFSLRAAAHLRRDVKPLLGATLFDEALWMAVLIQRANIAVGRAKLPYFVEILEHLEIIKFALRVARDQQFLPNSTWAASVPLVASLGKQANALKNHFDVPAPSPVT